MNVVLEIKRAQNTPKMRVHRVYTKPGIRILESKERRKPGIRILKSKERRKPGIRILKSKEHRTYPKCTYTQLIQNQVSESETQSVTQQT